MYETKDDLAWLQELLDRTLARANPQLASIVAPERRLNARQVVSLPARYETRRRRAPRLCRTDLARDLRFEPVLVG
jgi:hypothetical protein